MVVKEDSSEIVTEQVHLEGDLKRGGRIKEWNLQLYMPDLYVCGLACVT